MTEKMITTHTHTHTHLFPMVLNIAYLSPREGYLWREFVLVVINIETKCIHTQPQKCALLVLRRKGSMYVCVHIQTITQAEAYRYFKIVHSVHVQILGNLQILNLGLFSAVG